MEGRTYTYKNIEEVELKADVCGIADYPKPVILLIHGGSLISGTRGGRQELFVPYFEEKYIVVSPDYRLAPESKIDDIFEDILSVYEWARTGGHGEFPVTGEIVVAGHSAGGYLAQCLGVLANPNPSTVISFYGYNDISSEWYEKPSPYYLSLGEIKEEYFKGYVPRSNIFLGDPSEKNLKINGHNPRWWYSKWLRQRGLWQDHVVGIHYSKDTHEKYIPYCPLWTADKSYPPTYLLHGEKDTDVPYEQSVQMYEKLKNLGVDCRFYTHKNGDHGFDAKELSKEQLDALMDDVVCFTDTYCKVK